MWTGLLAYYLVLIIYHYFSTKQYLLLDFAILYIHTFFSVEFLVSILLFGFFFLFVVHIIIVAGLACYFCYTYILLLFRAQRKKEGLGRWGKVKSAVDVVFYLPRFKI